MAVNRSAAKFERVPFDFGVTERDSKLSKSLPHKYFSKSAGAYWFEEGYVRGGL